MPKKSKEEKARLAKLLYPVKATAKARAIQDGDAGKGDGWRLGKIPLNCMNCDKEFDHLKHYPIVLPCCTCAVAKCAQCIKEDLWASPKTYYGDVLCPKCGITIENSLICKNPTIIAAEVHNLLEYAQSFFDLRISTRSIQVKSYFPLCEKYKACGFEKFFPKKLEEFESVERVKITIAALEMMRRKCEDNNWKIIKRPSQKAAVAFTTNEFTVSMNGFESDDEEDDNSSSSDTGDSSDADIEGSSSSKQPKLLYDVRNFVGGIEKGVFDNVILNKNVLLYEACLEQSDYNTDLRRQERINRGNAKDDVKIEINIKCIACDEDILPKQSVLKACGCLGNPICRKCCLQNIGYSNKLSFDATSNLIYFMVDCTQCDRGLVLTGDTIENAINSVQASVLKIRVVNKRFFTLMESFLNSAIKFYFRGNPQDKGNDKDRRTKAMYERIYNYFKRMHYVLESESLYDANEQQQKSDLNNKLMLVVARLEHRRQNIEAEYRIKWSMGEFSQDDKKTDIYKYIINNSFDLGPLDAIELKPNFIIDYYASAEKKRIDAERKIEEEAKKKAEEASALAANSEINDLGMMQVAVTLAAAESDSDPEPDRAEKDDLDVYEDSDKETEEETDAAQMNTSVRVVPFGLSDSERMDYDNDEEGTEKVAKHTKMSHVCWFANCQKSCKNKSELRTHLNKFHKTKCLDVIKLLEFGFSQCSHCSMYLIDAGRCAKCADIDPTEIVFIEDEKGLFDSDHDEMETHRLVENFRIVTRDSSGDFCPTSLMNMLSGNNNSGNNKMEYFLEGHLWAKPYKSKKISTDMPTVSFDSWLLYSPELNKYNLKDPIIAFDASSFYKLKAGDLLLLKQFEKFRAVYILKKPSQEYKAHYNPHLGEIVARNFRGLYLPLMDAVSQFLNYRTQICHVSAAAALDELASFDYKSLLKASVGDGLKIENKVPFNSSALKRVETACQLAMYNLVPKDSKFISQNIEKLAVLKDESSSIYMNVPRSSSSSSSSSALLMNFSEGVEGGSRGKYQLAGTETNGAGNNSHSNIISSTSMGNMNEDSDDDDETMMPSAKRKFNDDSSNAAPLLLTANTIVCQKFPIDSYLFGTKENPLIIEIESLPKEGKMLSEKEYIKQFTESDFGRNHNGNLNIKVKISTTIQEAHKNVEKAKKETSQGYVNLEVFLQTTLSKIPTFLREKKHLKIGDCVMFRRKEGGKEELDVNSTLASLNVSTTTSFRLILMREPKKLTQIASAIITTATTATTINDRTNTAGIKSNSDEYSMPPISRNLIATSGLKPSSSSDEEDKAGVEESVSANYVPEKRTDVVSSSSKQVMKSSLGRAIKHNPRPLPLEQNRPGVVFHEDAEMQLPPPPTIHTTTNVASSLAIVDNRFNQMHERAEDPRRNKRLAPPPSQDDDLVNSLMRQAQSLQHGNGHVIAEPNFPLGASRLSQFPKVGANKREDAYLRDGYNSSNTGIWDTSNVSEGNWEHIGYKKIKSEHSYEEEAFNEEISFSVDYNGIKKVMNQNTAETQNYVDIFSNSNIYDHRSSMYSGAGGGGISRNRSEIRFDNADEFGFRDGGGDGRNGSRFGFVDSAPIIKIESQQHQGQYSGMDVIEAPPSKPMTPTELDLVFRRKIFANIDFKKLNPLVMFVHAPHLLYANDDLRYKAEKDLKNNVGKNDKLLITLRIYFATKFAIDQLKDPNIGIDYLEAPIYLASLNGNLEQIANSARQQLAVEYSCNKFSTLRGAHLQKSRSLAWYGIANNAVIELYPQSIPPSDFKMPGWTMPELRQIKFEVDNQLNIHPQIKVESNLRIEDSMYAGSSTYNDDFNATRLVDSPLTEDEEFFHDDNVDSSSDIDSARVIRRTNSIRKEAMVEDKYAVIWVPKIDDGEKPPEIKKERDPNKPIIPIKVADQIVGDLSNLYEVDDADDDEFSSDTEDENPNPNVKNKKKANKHLKVRPANDLGKAAPPLAVSYDWDQYKEDPKDRRGWDGKKGAERPSRSRDRGKGYSRGSYSKYSSATTAAAITATGGVWGANDPIRRDDKSKFVGYSSSYNNNSSSNSSNYNCSNSNNNKINGNSNSRNSNGTSRWESIESARGNFNRNSGKSNSISSSNSGSGWGAATHEVKSNFNSNSSNSNSNRNSSSGSGWGAATQRDDRRYDHRDDRRDDGWNNGNRGSGGGGGWGNTNDDRGGSSSRVVGSGWGNNSNNYSNNNSNNNSNNYNYPARNKSRSRERKPSGGGGGGGWG